MADFYRKIVSNGSYYCPAVAHYMQRGQNDVVDCDYCFQRNIETCIGYGDFDICLECVGDILQIEGVVPRPINLTALQ